MPPPSAPEPWSDADFRPIAEVVRGRQGPEVPDHRMDLMRARLRARLESLSIPSFSWFFRERLRGHPNGPDMQLLIDLGTVNHTTFFREPGPLNRLADHLTQRLRRPGTGPVRVWSAGCSAGQEPYSLAMLLTERVPDLDPSRLEVTASDLSLDVVRTAARAVYDDKALVDVSAPRLHRFFLKGRGPRQGECRIAAEVRRLITFRHFDLRDPSWPVPGGFDAILCRNVLIYFREPERAAMLDRMAPLLRPGGWLVIGTSEILPERPGLLAKYAPAIFRKGDDA